MLRRSIRDAFKSIIRNVSLSFASVTCITITLLIVAVALIASRNVDNITNEIEKDLTIVAFVKKEADTKDIEMIKDQLDSMSNIEKYDYQTKQEVKEKMQAESDVFATVLDEWDDDESPLKDTFQIKVKDVNKLKDTAETIKSLDKIETVKYGETLVDKMIRAFNTIKKGTYILVIALVIVTVFLIVNTIKLTISARKREIGIMRVVGASNFSIKLPFVIEGMFLGLLGSIIPIIFMIYGYIYFYNRTDGYLYSEIIKLIQPDPFVYQCSLILLVIGILVGMLGSLSAVRRYLKI
ncbi:MAG: permease-like cell division protein FtsX [Bacilli bacterium]|nr:permease-like cell division protein FtsX [Bacilli bacterium]